MTRSESVGERDARPSFEEDAELLRSASRLARFGAWSIEIPSGALHWTQGMYDMLGFVGKTSSGYERTMELYPPSHRRAVQEAVDRCIREGAPIDLESVVITASGPPLNVRIVGEAIRDAHDRIVRVQGGFVDISDVVREREQRLEAERTLRRSFDYLPDMVCFVDRSWRLTFANAAAVEFVRTPPDELYSRTIWELFPELAESELHEVYTRAMEKRESLTGRAYMGQFDRWVEATAHPLEDGIALFVRDVTDDELRRQDLAVVSERAVALASMVEVSNEAFMAEDLDNTVRFWNRGAELVYGWTREEAIGRNVRELIYADTAPFEAAMAELLRTGAWTGELHQRSKTGRPLIVSCRWQTILGEDGRPTSLFAVNSDVTELRRQQEVTNRTHRLESLGTLAGGIAHDLNNMLTPLMMSVGLMRSSLPEADRGQLLDVMELGIARGADMIRQVLSFARGVEGAREMVSAATVVDELRALTLAVLPSSIEVVIESEPMPPLLGDSTQILQVLVNLVTNARDAMPDGGVLRISTRAARIDATSPLSTVLSPGDYAEWEVVDTGTGMTDDVQSRIFDPFFTTKEVGQGTGLGLASSLAIARSHGGYLSVDSSPGAGARFVLHIPAAAAGSQPAMVPPSEPRSPRGEGELVLVVDDEPVIRATVCQTLEAHGYRTVQAANGRDAIEAAKREVGQVRVLLTDMMMPVMDGAATATYFSSHHPDVAIVAATGVSGSVAVDRVRAAGVRHFLAKPFTTETLLGTIRDALHKRAP